MNTTVYMQRTGVSKSFRATVGQLHIEVTEWQGRGQYCAEVVKTTPRGENPDKIEVVFKNWTPSPLSEILAQVEKALKLKIAPQVEAYMYSDKKSLAIWPYLAEDVFRTLAVYEKSTDTIRHARTNVCLIAFEGQTTRFIDAAAKPYEAILDRAIQEFGKEHNRRNSDEENKAWLAWLIGEWIKDEMHEAPEVLESMIR